MVEKVEKVVYVTIGGEEFRDREQAHMAEAVERLTTMLYELRNCDDSRCMAQSMLSRHKELSGIIAQYVNRSQ